MGEQLGRKCGNMAPCKPLKACPNCFQFGAYRHQDIAQRRDMIAAAGGPFTGHA